MAEGSATELASIGPITITYAFRSWVLVEAPGHESLRRRVRSEAELSEVLSELGVPATEADSVAARLWAARPADAGLGKVSPWEGFAPSTGYSRLTLFVAAVVIVVLAGLILWLVYG